jgi:hypothetical protein
MIIENIGFADYIEACQTRIILELRFDIHNRRGH